MIRVAVLGADDALCQALAPRLRHCAIVAGGGNDEADAAAILGAASAGEVERIHNTGKHLLVAAELFHASRPLQKVADSLRKDQSFSAVNLDRYLPSRRLIHEQLQAGKLGEPGLVRSQHWAAESADGPNLPRALLRDLDCILWLMGSIPSHVHALEHLSHNSKRAGIHIHLGFPGGGMALLDYACLPKTAGYTSLSVIGSKGAAYADDRENMQLVFAGGSATAVRTDEGIVALALAIQEFTDRLLAGTRMPGEPGDWHLTLAVSEAVLESLRTREVQTVEA